jgi:hypothetical protein
MLNYRPVLSLPSDLSPDMAAVERLGGQPWGLTGEFWPVCTDCKKRQSLLAQLSHHPQRLNLGAEGRMLFVFQCNHNPGKCETWFGSWGANACFVLEREQLQGTPFDHPPHAVDPDDHAVVITGWQEFDDGIDEATAKLIVVGLDDDVPDEIMDRLSVCTHLGGVPWWPCGSMAPEGDWTFIGQLDTGYSFYTAPKSEVPWVKVDEERCEGRTHVGDGPYFRGGMGYIFLRSILTQPEGWFNWEATGSFYYWQDIDV